MIHCCYDENNVADEIYHGLIFPRKCKTFDYELTIAYFLPEKSYQNEYNNEMRYKK